MSVCGNDSDVIMFPDRIDPRVTYTDQYFHMERDSLDEFPRVPLPAGYRLRAYRPGDEAHWIAMQQAAEPFFTVADDLFEKEYGGHRSELPGRMVFVETDAGDVVATASAWWEDKYNAPSPRGRVHWVVVRPDHQGRGLTKPMMTAVLERMAARHDSAMLGTSSGRVWAVKVYLDYGFHPVPAELETPEILQAWQDVQSVLQHPALAPWLDP